MKKSSKKPKRAVVNKYKYNKDLIGIIIIAYGLLTGLSLSKLNMGIIGSLIREFTYSFMGIGAYLLPIVMIGIGIIFIVDKFQGKEMRIVLGIVLVLLSSLIIIDGVNPSDMSFLDRIDNSILLSKSYRGGGILGSIFGFFFYSLFGPTGSYLILSLIIIINILLITDVKIIDIINLFKKEKKINITKEDSPKQLTVKEIKQFNEDIRILDYTKDQVKDSLKGINIKQEVENIDTEIKSQQSKLKIPSYKIPPLSLLKSPIHKGKNQDDNEMLNNAEIIVNTMKNFGIDCSIVQINRGPTITCYELQPSPGVKLSRIVSLSDNIALSLASSDIRIEAPIPGKAVVGIEVPNKVKSNVLFKEIILSKEYKNINSNIPLILGKNASGETIISTIDEMPHLLIAGATGSGKSVCINSIIMSIIYKSSPEEVKLLLIDPKVVELSVYNGIPHLLIPVVTNAKRAAFALNWAVEEMENRYKSFAENNVRDINFYNNKMEENNEEKLPTIIIIIDELADLMMVAAQEVEDYINRLAQMARAAGIYLIVATQRPSVDVITGTIKANIPSRISFAVSSQIDSRTILDMAGAEKLLGKGDMLFYPYSYSKPTRIQAAFISTEEVEDVVEFLKAQDITEYDEEIIEHVTNPKELDLDYSDELLVEAINLVVNEGQASISMLQRKLRIGHARAARIVDEMEERGIIGGYEGSKPRKVLLTVENLESATEEW